MSPFSTLDHLECPRCGATHDAAVLQGLCPACASPLLARYDLAAVASDAGGRRHAAAGPVALSRAAARSRGPSTS